MAKATIKFKYNGVPVTRKWLEFNYGSMMVSECVNQAERGFYSFTHGVNTPNICQVGNELVCNFGNGVVAYKAL